MSTSFLESTIRSHTIIGSILHGAYGDYYEQIVCLRHLKRIRPDVHFVLFFASESRLTELAVFDLSFADEVHPVSLICDVPVETFLQFQVHDPELRQEILLKLPTAVLQKFDLAQNLTPWSFIRGIYRMFRSDCDVPLGPLGLSRLPQCFHDNGLDESKFPNSFTVGFLWRHRAPGGAISSSFQSSKEILLRTKSALFSALAEQYGAQIIIAGMNCHVTKENRERIDAKFTESRLDVREDTCVYLKGLSWGLELEIVRRCSLCIVMPSGFSEALLMKRSDATVLVDPPVHYLAKLLWNRMPFFGVWNARNLAFYLRQPHTAERVLEYLHSRNLIGPRGTYSDRP
jgi:hypothetical protein